MKKLLLVLAVASLAFVACNDSGTAEDAPKTDSPAVVAPPPTTPDSPAVVTPDSPKVDTLKK